MYICARICAAPYDYITEANISIISLLTLRIYAIDILSRSRNFIENNVHNFYAHLYKVSINFDDFINNDTLLIMIF